MLDSPVRIRLAVAIQATPLSLHAAALQRLHCDVCTVYSHLVSLCPQMDRRFAAFQVSRKNVLYFHALILSHRQCRSIGQDEYSVVRAGPWVCSCSGARS